MVDLVKGTTAMEAWERAATLLLARKGCEATNVLIEIEKPAEWDASWFIRIDPRLIDKCGEDPRNVANTLFPLRTWLGVKSRPELYARYQKAHKRGRKKSWGTYFLRLIDFGQSHVNQLERAIEVMTTWQNDPGTSIVFHFSSPETDRPRPLGGPCLQLCQLQVHAGQVDATVVYRNRDYFNKALANFVGIGRLLEFICAETGQQVGKLSCLSGHAYSAAGKRSLDRLLKLT